MLSVIGVKGLSKSINSEVLIEWSFFLVFMSFLLVVNHYNHLFFHTAIELFINCIFVLIFVFAFNTYNINKDNSMLVIGTGYFFVAMIGIVHLLSYSGMPFLSFTEEFNVAPKLWIAARYMEVITCFIAIGIIRFKYYKKINSYALFLIYFAITILILLSIFVLEIFPMCFRINVGPTSFKVISEYILCAGFFIIAAIVLKTKEKIDRHLFAYFECFLVLSGIAEMFFISNITINDSTSSVGHIIKVLAAYFAYKGVVETGLKKPYNVINYNLNMVGDKLRQFEELIFSNEQCFNMIINSCDNGIIVVTDYKISFANKRTAELLGAQNVEDIIGLDIGKVMVNEFKKPAYKRISNAIANKVNTPFTESKLLKLDGKNIDIEVTNRFCLYQGKASALVMFRDITPIKHIKLLESDIIENKKMISKTTELNKMMTEFFSNISHELKTPLNVLLGAIQILSLPTNEAAKAGTNKYLKTMKQNCYRLVRLVNNLIDISKFDSGYFKLNLHNYNVVNAIEDITLSVADYAKNKGIELLFDTDIEEKEMAIDLDKIERIILNMLSNAIKFTNEGGNILVNLYDKGDKIQLSIKDNGVGIPEDKLAVIFERFGQVDKTLARNSQGSGIGLSLVKSIVDMHEGTIKVLSEFGKGSEFIIELPVRLVEEEESLDGRLYESKVEKISVEFADIYS